MNPRLDRYLVRVRDLPTMPAVADAVSREVEKPETTSVRLRQIIEQDPAIVARILRVANSALYSFPRQIQSLDHAITLLGFRAVRNLVLTVSLHEVFQRFGLMEKLLWEHSAAAGPLAARIAEHPSVDVPPDDAFTAGLLHDLGKIALANSHREDYEGVVERVYNEGIRYVDAEREAFGFDHAELGARVAARWKLPETIEAVIRHHHDPAGAALLAEPDRRLTWVASLTSCLLTKLGVGRRAPVEALDLCALESWRGLGLGDADLDPLLEMTSEVTKNLGELRGG